MSIIVGSQTYAECEVCRAKTTSTYDQRKIYEIMQREGFYYSQTTGKVYCKKHK